MEHRNILIFQYSLVPEIRNIGLSGCWIEISDIGKSRVIFSKKWYNKKKGARLAFFSHIRKRNALFYGRIAIMPPPQLKKSDLSLDFAIRTYTIHFFLIRSQIRFFSRPDPPLTQSLFIHRSNSRWYICVWLPKITQKCKSYLQHKIRHVGTFYLYLFAANSQLENCLFCSFF